MRNESDTATARGPTPGSTEMTSRGSAILALTLLIPAPSVGATFGLILLPGPVGSTIYALCKLWMCLLPAVWWLWVEKQRPGWSPPRKGGFAVAAALGLAISVVIFTAYYTIGVGLIDPQ